MRLWAGSRPARPITRSSAVARTRRCRHDRHRGISTDVWLDEHRRRAAGHPPRRHRDQPTFDYPLMTLHTKRIGLGV